MLTFNPVNRISAQEALDHPYFNGSDSSASQDSGIVMLQEEVANILPANESVNGSFPRTESSASNVGSSASIAFSSGSDKVEEINGTKEGISISVKRKRSHADVDDDNDSDDLDYDDDDDDDVDEDDDVDDANDDVDDVDDYYDGDNDTSKIDKDDGEKAETSRMSST